MYREGERKRELEIERERRKFSSFLVVVGSFGLCCGWLGLLLLFYYWCSYHIHLHRYIRAILHLTCSEHKISKQSFYPSIYLHWDCFDNGYSALYCCVLNCARASHIVNSCSVRTLCVITISHRQQQLQGIDFCIEIKANEKENRLQKPCKMRFSKLFVPCCLFVGHFAISIHWGCLSVTWLHIVLLYLIYRNPLGFISLNC